MAALATSACVLPAQFSGLKPLSLKSSATLRGKTSFAVVKSRTRADLATSPVIIASTASLLFLGRFVFLPFQRDNVARQGLPVQNGVTHAQAGDDRAIQVEGMLKTNDPSGFNIVDVLAWGSLGHAIGYAILAIGSNGYNPQF